MTSLPPLGSALLTILIAAHAIGQEVPKDFASEIHITAIDLIADVRDPEGRVPEGLVPADFVVIEDGTERPVIALEYLGSQGSTADQTAPREGAQPEWQILIYFDQNISSTYTIQTLAKSLASRASDLAALGTVEIVVAHPAPRRTLDPTRNAPAIEAALLEIAKQPGRERLAMLRKEFLERQNSLGSLGTDAPVPIEIMAAVQEEVRLLQRFRNELSAWLAMYERRLPRALLLVTDGFDVDLGEFYLGGLQDQRFVRELHFRVQDYSRMLAHDDLARAMSSAGWTTISLMGGTRADFPRDASTSGGPRFRAFLEGSSSGASPTFLLLHPRDPLLAYADATGGSILSDPRKVGTAIQDLTRRIKLTYQVSRPVDDKVRKVEVKARRKDLKVSTFRWVSSSTPEMVAQARAIQTLESRTFDSDLPITAKLEMEKEPRGRQDRRKGTITAQVDLTSLGSLRAKLTSTSLRITVATDFADDQPFVHHQVIVGQDLSKIQKLDYTAPINLPKSTRKVAVLVEELTSGMWGAAVVSLDTPLAAESQPPSRADLSLPETSDNGVKWYTSWEPAFAVAREQRKLVFAYFFPFTNRKIDREIRTALDHPAVVRRLVDFVPLRISSELRKVYGVSEVIPHPGFAVFDPWGRFRIFRKVAGETAVAEALQAAFRVTQDIVRAGELLNSGQEAEAYFALGAAYLKANLNTEARAVYHEARRLAEQRGDRAQQQTIDIHVALTQAQEGKAREAMQTLTQIAAEAAGPAVAAEAWLGIGHIHQVTKDERKAIEAYIRAAEMAPQGSRLRELAGNLAGLGTAPESGLKAIHLIKPIARPLSGQVRFETLVTRPDIDRVDFLLDGRMVTSAKTPPFSAKLDLGEVPREHSIEVIAYGLKGREIARDSLTVNRRHDQLSVKITGPRTYEVSGTVTVEAAVNAPEQRRIDRVEFFWNEMLRGSDREPPFAQTMVIPQGKPTGYIRAVAFLEDGTEADDVLVVNTSGRGETIEVHLVELYTAVTDSGGNPVKGLTAADFVVVEDKVAQPIERVEFVERPPLFVGMAIDSSGSTKDEILDLQKAAADFLRWIIDGESQAFLVDFDSSPRLLQHRTGDVETLVRRLDDLNPGGSTALYDAVIFGSLQFQGVTGKKTLVVLTDGQDLTSRYDFERAIEVAKRMGVSIYAIVIDSDYYAFNVGDARMRHEMERLTIETGGKAFYLRTAGELQPIFRQIHKELSNHYVLVYRPNRMTGDDRWHDVSVVVQREGIRSRTISGYYDQD